MKYLQKSVLVLVIVCAGVAFGLYRQYDAPKISDTTLANVEALASGESIGSSQGPSKQFMCGVMEGYKGCVKMITVCMGKDETDCEGAVCDRHNM